eukprot:2775343-Prymnesium_polylepis.1
MPVSKGNVEGAHPGTLIGYLTCGADDFTAAPMRWPALNAARVARVSRPRRAAKADSRGAGDSMIRTPAAASAVINWEWVGGGHVPCAERSQE